MSGGWGPPGTGDEFAGPAPPTHHRDPRKVVVYQVRSTGRWRVHRYVGVTVDDYMTWREAMDHAPAASPAVLRAGG